MWQTIFQRAATRLFRQAPCSILIEDPDKNRFSLGTGEGPAFRIQIRNPGAYRRLLLNPSLGLSESYAAGELEIEGDLVLFFRALYDVLAGIRSRSFAAARRLERFSQTYLTPHTLRASRRDVAAHYDRFERVIGKITGATRTYSCAYFAESHYDLDTAQRAKTLYSLQKLMLEPGMRLLDIGCGSGYLIAEAAEQGVFARGITLSSVQLRHARALIRQRGLSERCEAELLDYRQERGCYDRVASIGMLEHVGVQRLGTFFRKVHQLLRDGGLALIHSVIYPTPCPTDPTVRKHIFPGTLPPALSEILQAAERAGLRAVDCEDLKPHYAATLLRWYDNLRAARGEIETELGAWFYRMWEIFLTGAAASFLHEQGMGVVQTLFSKGRPRRPPTRDYMGGWRQRLAQTAPVA